MYRGVGQSINRGIRTQVASGLVAIAIVTHGVVFSGTSAQDASADVVLGTVTLSVAVRADGQTLPAGTYEVRLTSRVADPVVAGPPPESSPWVEFVQGNTVRGREVAAVVEATDVAQVAKGTPPPRGAVKVEPLQQSDYLRIWANDGSRHYLIHLLRG